MRVVKPSRLREYAKAYARAGKSLESWYVVVRKAHWHYFFDVKSTFGSADEVRVASGKNVIVFNIGGNNFRLIGAVHYDRKKIFILRFMTHAEYSKNEWKKTL